jgi:hypothetical protein
VKRLLRAVYMFLTGPLYRRLSHEMAVKLQAQVDAQLEFEERFIQRVLDDLVVLSIQVEEQNRFIHSIFPNCELSKLPVETLADAGLTDVQIVQLIHDTRTGKDLVSLAEDWNVTPMVVARLKARLHGMESQSIGLIRALERENTILTKALAARSDYINMQPLNVTSDKG